MAIVVLAAMATWMTRSPPITCALRLGSAPDLARTAGRIPSAWSDADRSRAEVPVHPGSVALMLLIYAYDEGNAAASVVTVQDWVAIVTIQHVRSAWAATAER